MKYPTPTPTPPPPRSPLVRALRIVGFAVLGVVLVAFNLIAAGFFYLKTDHAREHLLAFGLARAQPLFPGGLTVARSEGDLTRGVVLHDIALHDRDGRPAVTLARLELDYSLLPLLGLRVQVDRVNAIGATVVSQPLADGRDNLATIADIVMPPIPKTIPVSVALADVKAQLRFTRREEGKPAIDAAAVLMTRAHIDHGFRVDVPYLSVDALTPAIASLRAKGGVHVDRAPTLYDVEVRVDGDTAQLRRSVDQLHLRGPALVIVKADGKLDDLVATVAADTQTPAVSIRAATHVFADRVALDRFTLESSFANADAHGLYKFDQTGHGEARVDAPDLSPLRLLGVPDIGGAVKLAAKLSRDDEHFTAIADGWVRRLRIGKNRIEKIDIDVDVKDTNGHAIVAASSLQLGDRKLDRADVTLDGTPSSARARITARGAHGLALDLQAIGAPQHHGKRTTGIATTLQRLRFRAGGTPWLLDRPATIVVDFDAPRVAVSPLALHNRNQWISVEGKLVAQRLEDVHVEVKHFDLSQLPAVLSPGHVLPYTDLSAKAEASGPLAQPNVGASFEGTGHGRTQHDLIHFTTTGEGRLARGRLAGKVFATIGGQKVAATADVPMPLRPDQPLDVSFNASVLLNPWFADLLVPKAIQSQPILMYRLGAKVTAQGSIKGTTSDPRINASARVARWGAADSHGNFAVSVEYKQRRLDASSTLTLSELPLGGGKGAGIIEATAQMPIDLAPTFSGEPGVLFDRRGAWHASVNAKHVAIEKLPWEALEIVPFVRRGWVDATAELSGSQSHPKATVKFDAKDVEITGASDIAAAGQLKLDGIATTAHMNVTVRGSNAMLVRGTMAEGTKATWRDAPISATIDVPGFDLGKLGMFETSEGRVRGGAKIEGTWSQPIVDGVLTVVDLRTGEQRHDRVAIAATLRRGVVVASFAADQPGGGKLLAEVTGTRSGEALSGSLQAKHYRLDLRSEKLPMLRLLRGEIDGNVALGGTPGKPRLDGKVVFANGQLALASTAITTRDLNARLAFAGDAIVVEELRAKSGTGGTLEANGRVRVADFRATDATGHIALQKFPLKWGNNLGKVDGALRVEGARDARQMFTTTITIERAHVELQDDAARRGLIPTAVLEDVKVGRARPEPVANPLDGKPRVAAPASQSPPLVALHGPITVHGAELDIAADAGFHIHFNSGIPTAVGTLSLAPNGVVNLYGQRYVLERGRLVFGNIAQPELDLHITRRTDQAKLGLDIGGSVRQPTTKFWSDPPVYSNADVARLITGQPRLEPNRVGKRGIEEKIAGPISNLISVSFQQNDPATKTVDVERPQPTPLKTMNKQ